MSDYQIKDVLAQFCVILNCINDIQNSLVEMRESVKRVMAFYDEELNKVEPIKERDND